MLAARDLPSPDELVRSIGPVEAELLRLLLLVPDEQLRVADRLPPHLLSSALARELWGAMLADREPGPDGEPRRFERGRFLDALDEESRALAIALYASRAPIPGLGDSPDGGAVDVGLVDHGVDQCILRLELDRLEERGAYTRGELTEAELRGDAASIPALMEDERSLNEARRSLHRRIDDASLLARTPGGRP